MEGIQIKRNANAGKSIKDTKPCRIDVVQAIVNAFLSKDKHPNRRTYSSIPFWSITTINLKTNEFDGEYVNSNTNVEPNEVEMQKAFDILDENGYYIFVRKERHRDYVGFEYKVSEYNDTYLSSGYKLTKKFETPYYV